MNRLQTTERAFLVDILQHPDDDAPRLIYADWLDEHGQPERAEFIRVQCELDHVDLDDGRREYLEQRVSDLIEKHGAAWKAEVGLEERCEVEYFRGFIEGVYAFARSYINEGDVWASRTPLRMAHLRHAHGMAGRLALCSHQSSLAKLVIADDQFDDDDLAALTSTIHLPALTCLCLSGAFAGGGTSIGGAGLIHLAEAAFFPVLETLAIRSGRGLNSHGLRLLSTRKAELALSLLDLSLCSIDDQGAAALANLPGLGALGMLFLNHNVIGDGGLAALASSASLPNATCLELEGNRVTGTAFATLAEAQDLRGLGMIHLAFNPIETVDLDALDVVLGRCPRLRMSLKGCPLPRKLQEELSVRWQGRVVVDQPAQARRRGPIRR